MKVITFANLKGGTGKSNVLFHVAGMLAEDKKTCLVLDLDAQANITNNFGIKKTPDMATVVDIFENDIALEHMITKTKFKHVFLIAGSIKLTKTEIDIVRKTAREQLLKAFLYKNKDFLEKFDYILVDTNPSFNQVNINSFVVSDSIILVNDASMNSLEGSEQFVELWSDIRSVLGLEDNIKAFVVNNFDKRRKIDKDFLEYVRQHDTFKDILIEPPIPNNSKYKEAELQAKPVMKGLSYTTYRKFYNELINKGVL